jgi:long-chain acyl-CoA synthetase
MGTKAMTGLKLDERSTLPDLLLERVRATPEAGAYRQFDGQRWIEWSWAEIGREVARWQAALAREGLAPGERVALCLHNRVEWVLFDQAALGLGLVDVPLYFDDRPDNMAFCLNDAGVRLLLLEDGAQWAALKASVKTVTRVVCLANASAVGDERAVNLREWLPAEIDEAGPRRGPAKADDLATIVYTSGTTGRPKGVMLSHRNILSNVIAAFRALPAYPHDSFLSFLPLSHMFERTCGYYYAILAGAKTIYARGIKELAEDLKTQRPTLLIAVPRIFERIYARLQEQMPPGSLKRRLFERAVDIGWKRFQGQANWRENLLWPIFRLLVAKKLHRRLGGRIRLIVVGGAAFAPEHARVFIGLGLPIIQGYGLTEAAPVLTANRPGDNDPLSVGRALEGIELRCAENGELLARGPNVMLGYWNNPEATAAVIDQDGWLHTGDIVRIVGGRVYITGRLKEIIVLSNGEKVPPVDLEQAILVDPVFEHVMVVGEGRPKLGLLAVSRLADEAELCARANRLLKDFPGYAKICHIARVEGPWTVENGLLTPTLKLKRPEIEKRYAKEIEAMYETSEICCPKGKSP